MNKIKHGPRCQGIKKCEKEDCCFLQTGVIKGYCCRACMNNKGRHGGKCEKFVDPFKKPFFKMIKHQVKNEWKREKKRFKEWKQHHKAKKQLHKANKKINTMIT